MRKMSNGYEQVIYMNKIIHKLRNLKSQQKYETHLTFLETKTESTEMPYSVFPNSPI